MIASYSRGDLKSMAFKGWAKKQFDARPVQGVGFSVKQTLGDYTVEASAPTEEAAIALMNKAAQPEKPCGCKDAVIETPAVEPVAEDKSASPEGLGGMANVACCPECGHEAPMSAFVAPYSDGLGSQEDNIPSVQPRSFDSLRKEIVAAAFAASVEEVSQLSLQLRGVLDIAEARRESMKWQETYESLGIE